MITELQRQAIDLAKKQLQDKPWFAGVCLDHLPSDRDIERGGLQETADALALDTAYWDAPSITQS